MSYSPAIGSVISGKVVASPFVKKTSTKEGSNSYYEDTWESLEALVQDHFEDNEPGTGSKDNDVLLVRVPAQGFYTSIARITPENQHLIVEESHVRQEGEKPITHRVIRGGFSKPPADLVKIVIYRADVLAQDDNRSSDAEWEIVAILAQEGVEEVPMHPETMKRNSNHDVGGTYREYSQAQWDAAYAYWDNHVYIEN